MHHFIAIIEFKLELQYGNAQFGSKSTIFCPLWPDRWPCKTIGHLFNTTLSFVHHFKAIGEFKLDLQSGNAQFGSKSVIFLSPVTLQFDGWPWKTIRHLFYTTLSFVHHFKAIVNSNWSYSPETPNLGQNQRFFCPLWPWKTIGHLFYAASSFVHHFIAITEFKLELESGNT